MQQITVNANTNIDTEEDAKKRTIRKLFLRTVLRFTVRKGPLPSLEEKNKISF